MNYRTIMTVVVLVSGFSASVVPSDVIRTDHVAERFSSNVTKEDLLGLVDGNPHMQYLAQEIIEMAYEREPKALMASKNAYGCEFPLYPELLAAYLKSAKGKTVLEIAAGHGEHGLLFTLAGANRVYINDIEPENFGLVREVMAQLPPEYINRIHLLPHDCFDLQNKKELHQSCDLIIVRNLIHFFTKEKREQFFKMIALLLKPGGEVLLSVNAPATSGFPLDLIERYPDTTLFHRIAPVVSTPGLPRQPFATGTYLGEYFVGDPQADPLAYTFSPLITFVPTGIEKHAALNQFSPEAQQGIVNQAQKLIERYGISYLREKVITL